MTAEQTALLKILSAAISGKKVSLQELKDIDWQQLLEESKYQTVSLIAFELIAHLSEYIPKEIYLNWLKMSASTIASNNISNAAQKELVNLLDKNSCDYLIIKGESSAAYYPNPQLRTFGDVDFLIKPTDKEKIKDLLLSEGYHMLEENHICHIAFLKDKYHIEMHFEPPGIPEGELGVKVRNFLNDIFINVKSCNGFKAPQDVYQGLILLLHMQHHFISEGIGLRHLFDWACFVKETCKLNFWETTLIPFLKEIGLFDFTCALTETACRYFGIEKPKWITEIDAELSQGIMEDILYGGNFGSKDKTRQKSGVLISNRGKNGTRNGKIYNLFIALKLAVNKVYPISLKYPATLIVLMPYRALRQMFLILKGERYNILKAIPSANKRKALYDRLHIFEVKNNER